MLKRTLAFVNFFVLIFILWWNYYSNTGNIDGKTIGEVSSLLTNLFTPASYAFSIWGIIYLLLFASSLFIIKISFSNTYDTFIYNATPYLIIANLLNGLWIWFWLNQEILSSVLVMLSILITLITAAIKLRLEKDDEPLRILFFIWWPITIYLGWISVATVANISAYLTFIKWEFIFEDSMWALIMLLIVGAISMLMIYKRNMREFAGVAIWALIAIAVRNWNTEAIVAKMAIAISLLLFIEVIRHALNNKRSLPHNKWKRKEW